MCQNVPEELVHYNSHHETAVWCVVCVSVCVNSSREKVVYFSCCGI